MKPRLLDLFCKAGGAGMGYHLAGFEVVGVDIEPQPRYPFPFVLMDALEALRILIAGGCITDSQGNKWYLDDFTAIHASPPCQAYSAMKLFSNGTHPELVEPVRELLHATGKPYIIENVPGAPLENPLMLCGTMFGLRVIRHRLFETSPVIWWPPFSCNHWGSTGGGAKGKISSFKKADFICVVGERFYKKDASIAMGIDWMTSKELSQAIPPAYTKWLGEWLLEQMTFEVRQ